MFLVLKKCVSGCYQSSSLPEASESTLREQTGNLLAVETRVKSVFELMPRTHHYRLTINTQQLSRRYVSHFPRFFIVWRSLNDRKHEHSCVRQPQRWDESRVLCPVWPVDENVWCITLLNTAVKAREIWESAHIAVAVRSLTGFHGL